MRKTMDYTVSDAGRDQGKVFQIMEMPARQAEKWAMRALCLVGRAGIDLPDVPAGGMEVLARLGIQALFKVDFDAAEPLLDEMMECVRIKPDARNPNLIRPLIDDDIEEVATRLKLRMEVLNLHVGFSTGGIQSTLNPASPPPQKPPASSTTPMSPGASAPSSPQARRR